MSVRLRSARPNQKAEILPPTGFAGCRIQVGTKGPHAPRPALSLDVGVEAEAPRQLRRLVIPDIDHAPSAWALDLAYRSRRESERRCDVDKRAKRGKRCVLVDRLRHRM